VSSAPLECKRGHDLHRAVWDRQICARESRDGKDLNSRDRAKHHQGHRTRREIVADGKSRL